RLYRGRSGLCDAGAEPAGALRSAQLRLWTAGGGGAGARGRCSARRLWTERRRLLRRAALGLRSRTAAATACGNSLFERNTHRHPLYLRPLLAILLLNDGWAEIPLPRTKRAGQVSSTGTNRRYDCPPLQLITCPVIKLASSEARKAMAAACSSGRPRRCRACWLRMSCAISRR